MTTTFPQSPAPQRGSFVAIDLTNSTQTTINFQYNPETLTRKLTPQVVTGTHDRNEALRLKGPPQETISVVIEIDAADQLEKDDSDTKQYGIHPILAALELLVYPKSQTINDNENMAAKGVIEILPIEGPLVLFVWGNNRRLPVKLNSYSITEESFDPDLNPINAKVSLDMQVLTYLDLNFDSKGASLFMKYHQDKENLASKYSKTAASSSS